VALTLQQQMLLLGLLMGSSLLHSCGSTSLLTLGPRTLRQQGLMQQQQVMVQHPWQ
jgi:hypothetical protein